MKLYLSSFLIGDRGHELPSLCRGRQAVVVANALDNMEGPRAIRLDGQRNDLRDIGFHVEELDLRQYFGKTDALARRLDEVGLVWVTGGNVFLLRHAMRLSGFDECVVARRRQDDAFVYGGYSAGMCVAGASLRGLHLVDDVTVVTERYSGEVLWDGLGLVPYCLAPHYESDHPESRRIAQVVEYFIANKMPFIALRDGEVLMEDAKLIPR